VLKLSGATIEKATRAEFDEFRRTQFNLVKRESYHSASGSDQTLEEMHLPRLTKPFGIQCDGYMRFRLPEPVRALARAQWPQARPTYWRPDTYEAERAITDALQDSPQIQSDRSSDPPHSWKELHRFPIDGLATRSGGGLVSSGRGFLFPPAYYPSTDDYITHNWPQDQTQWPSLIAAKDVFLTSDLHYRDGRMRGFGYCGAYSSLPDELRASFLEAVSKKLTAYRVDGQDVVSKRRAGNAGDTWFFERDEAIFQHFSLGLGSTRGDV
jgi:hypothetical protein